MKKLLPLLMLLIGTGAGVGAGVFFRPPPEVAEITQEEKEGKEEANEEVAEDEEGLPIDGKEYIKLTNQFVVPIVDDERVSSMVVMTLSVETLIGQEQEVFDIEPKIRDVFLRVLFDHASIGGFKGAFLNNDNLDVIRRSLRDAARKNFGENLVSDVLIFEIARQDY